MAKWQPAQLDLWLTSAKTQQVTLQCEDHVSAKRLRAAMYPRRARLGLSHVELSVKGEKLYLTPIVSSVVLL